MAFALACECSYFRKNMFETKNNILRHSMLPHAIRKYVLRLWVLQYYHTRLPYKIFLKILQHVIVSYDNGFRMPKEGNAVHSFQWPKAVPLEYFERTTYSLDTTVIYGDIIILPCVNTYLFGSAKVTPQEINYMKLNVNSATGTYAPICIQSYLFYAGRVPVFWANKSFCLIGVTESYKTCTNVIFVWIYQATGSCRYSTMREIVRADIDPCILIYLTRNYTLNDSDYLCLQEYIQTYRYR